MEINQIEDTDMKELEEMAYKVDLLPKNFRIGAMFMMSGYTFLHVGKQKVVMVRFEDDAEIELPRA